MSVEERLRRLDRIVAALDAEDIELEESLELFEEGIGHVRAAERLLSAAELRVEELIEGEGPSAERSRLTGTSGARESPAPDGDFDLAFFLETQGRRVGRALEGALASLTARAGPDLAPVDCGNGLLTDGKRVRPILCVAAYAACGREPGDGCYDLAASIEMIHALLAHARRPAVHGRRRVCAGDRPPRTGRSEPGAQPGRRRC